MIFEIKKQTEAFSKLQSFREDNRISNENFWKYFANLLELQENIYGENFLFGVFFGLIFFLLYFGL